MFDVLFFNNLLGQTIAFVLRGGPTFTGQTVVAAFDNVVVFDSGFRVLLTEIVAVDVTGSPA